MLSTVPKFERRDKYIENIRYLSSRAMRALPILPRCFQTPRPASSSQRQEKSSIILSSIRLPSESSLMRLYAPNMSIRQYSLSARMCSPFPRYSRLSATSLRAERISPDASTISRPTAARAATATIRSRAADTVTVTATASVTATVTVMDTEAIPDRMTKQSKQINKIYQPSVLL